MSSVRMCDRCSTIFSERGEGWSTFTGATRKRNDDGQWVTQSDTLDSCPECTELMTAPPQMRPVPELGTSVRGSYEHDQNAPRPRPVPDAPQA
jgi:hypothetical protein